MGYKKVTCLSSINLIVDMRPKIHEKRKTLALLCTIFTYVIVKSTKGYKYVTCFGSINIIVDMRPKIHENECHKSDINFSLMKNRKN